MDTYPAAELARDLGVSPGDVRTVAAWLDCHTDQLPREVCGDVRAILNPNLERTAPAGRFWPGHQAPDNGGYGVGSKSPTDWPDGPYLWDDEIPDQQ